MNRLLLDLLSKRLFILFMIIYSARNVLELFIQPRIRERDNKSAKRGVVSLAVLVGAFAVSGLNTAYLLAAGGDENVYIFAVGIMLFTAGFAGRVIGMRALGENYSQYIQAPAKGELVTTGIYSVVRHPIYFFL